MILHRDGRSWSRVPIGSLRAAGCFYAVAAVSARDAWAVGYLGVNAFSGTALIEHWDGSAWARVRPRLPAAVSLLTDVAAVSGRDAWAVGLLPNNQPLTLHWDGTAWHRWSLD